MIATGWLALRSWHELEGTVAEAAAAEPAVPLSPASPSCSGWARSATRSGSPLDDLAAASRPRCGRRGTDVVVRVVGPRRVARRGGTVSCRRRVHAGRTDCASRCRAGRRARVDPARRGVSARPGPRGRGRTEPAPRRAAQHRWDVTVLALGPTPPPRPTFEHFLFVQPNFEMIAYRQGLTPQLVGPAQPVRLVVADRTRRSS